MNTILGGYWAISHWRQQDFDYFRTLQPKALRILEADANKMNRAYSVAPTSLYFPRWWEITEDQNKIDMMNDPINTAKKHMNWWKIRINEWKKQGLIVPESQIVVVGINEPIVTETAYALPDKNKEFIKWNQWRDSTLRIIDKVVQYNVAAIKEANSLGLRVSALNLSVGHPTNWEKDGKSDWTPFLPLYEVLKNSNHFLTVHEYYYKNIENGYGWHCGRIQHNNWKDINIIIGEFGYERRVVGINQQPWGYVGNITEKEYAQNLVKYIKTLQQDKRIKAVLPFITDYYDKQWESLDTLSAHNDILFELNNINNYNTLPYDLSWMNGETIPEPPIPPVEVSKKLIWPLDEVKITQYFGQSLVDYSKYNLRFHNGIDFACIEGTNVKSVADGIVKWVDFDSVYGNYIRIFHPEHKACSFYAHLKQLPNLKIGDIVKQGDIIAKSGNTGTGSNGAHLHLEFRLMKNETDYLPINTGASPKGQVDFLSIMHYYNNRN